MPDVVRKELIDYRKVSDGDRKLSDGFSKVSYGVRKVSYNADMFKFCLSSQILTDLLYIYWDIWSKMVLSWLLKIVQL